MRRSALVALAAVAVVLATTIQPASAAFPPTFFPSSPSWSQALATGTLPLDANNNQMKSNWAWQNHDGSFSQGAGPNIYEVRETDPEVDVSCTVHCSRIPTGTRFRVPAGGVVGAPAGTNGDRWIAIVNVDKGTELDLWHGSQDATGLHGEGGAFFETTDSAAFGWACNNTPALHPRCDSATGSGAALTAGTIMPSDLYPIDDDYSIHHALAFVPRFVRSGFTACPATANDGQGAPTDPPEGARFFLDRSFTPPAQWAKISRKVARALQVYGGIVMDEGSWAFRFQANGTYTGAWDGSAVHYPQGWWDWQGTVPFPWDKLNFLPITNCTA